MRLGRVLSTVSILSLAVLATGCTKVKPAPEESLSLSGSRPSLSAMVVSPPAGTGQTTTEAGSLVTASASPVGTPSAGLTGVSQSVAPTPIPAPTATPEARYLTHVVGWGDTILSIALQYGARMEAIVEANELTNNMIYIGQTLQIPLPEVPIGAQQYVVQAGDTLSGIAIYLGVDQDALLRANGLTNGYYLQVGQVLIVPSGGGAQMASASDTSVQAAGLGSKRSHIVQPGDSLSSISAMYNVSAYDISTANSLGNPNLLQVGQTLIIP